MICVLLRKPPADSIPGTVLHWGTGIIAIDASRVPGKPPNPCRGTGWGGIDQINAQAGYRDRVYTDPVFSYTPNLLGRFPTNVLLSLSQPAIQFFHRVQIP